jgi:hypothetical protein
MWCIRYDETFLIFNISYIKKRGIIAPFFITFTKNLRYLINISMKNIIAIFLLSALVFTACKKEVEPVSLNVAFKPTNKGSGVVAGGILKDVDNKNFSLDEFKFYISNIEVTDVKDVKTKINRVVLYDLGVNDYDIFYDIPEGNYKSISFGLGLDTATNNTNPNSVDETDPLSISQGTYWDMLKYRFVVLEGKFDSTVAGNTTPNKPFALHIGTDQMYRTVEVFKPFEITGGKNYVELPFEINELFYSTTDTIRFSEHYSNDSENEVQLDYGNRIMNFFKNAF